MCGPLISTCNETGAFNLLYFEQLILLQKYCQVSNVTKELVDATVLNRLKSPVINGIKLIREDRYGIHAVYI